MKQSPQHPKSLLLYHHTFSLIDWNCFRWSMWPFGLLFYFKFLKLKNKTRYGLLTWVNRTYNINVLSYWYFLKFEIFLIFTYHWYIFIVKLIWLKDYIDTGVRKAQLSSSCETLNYMCIIILFWTTITVQTLVFNKEKVKGKRHVHTVHTFQFYWSQTSIYAIV